MKLYYKPGACSLASHIVLREVGVKFELEKVDTGAGKTASGEDFSTVNPKGYVPALRLDDGRVLTEGAAILQFIADRNPDAKLAPAPGTFERSKVQEHLNFVSSELHKSFLPFFGRATLDAGQRQSAEAVVLDKLAYYETVFSDGREYLSGDTFGVADAYLFVVSNWSNAVGISLDGLPRVKAFVARVAARDATRAAMQAEGLAA